MLAPPDVWTATCIIPVAFRLETVMGNDLERNSQAPDNRSGSPSPTKTRLLSALIADAAACDVVGPAWRLVLRLMLVEMGSMIGTYDEIGEAVGISSRTARNWANELAGRRVIEKRQQGRRVKITLLEPYRSVATAPDCVVEKDTPIEAPQDPRIQSLLEVGRIAVARQSKVEVKLVL